MNSDVEEIKNRVSIVDLVGEYVRLTKAGSNWRALCPFHNEKTPSFMVSEERRSYHCFGCGKGGDIFSFVMDMEGIGFREALEQLAPKAGVTLKKFAGGEARAENVKPKLYKILELATKWYEKNLWEGRGKDSILKYLRERGLTDESIKKFRLGYAPDGWDNMFNFLAKKGFKVQDIEKTGLLVKKETAGKAADNRFYDRFRERIVFPVQDVMGRVAGYSARVAPGGDEKSAKYINTPQTELYDKSKILYGLHAAKMEIKKKDEVILVEGNMDVIASHQAGFANTIAVSGTALTPEQIKAIKRYTENIKMAFDMDAAGQEAAKRSAKICLESDLNVRIVLLPSGKDAADVIRENKNIWGKALDNARGLLDYYFEDAFSRLDPKNPTDKKKIAKILLSIIKNIANPVEQSHWLKVLAEKLGTEEKILTDILRRTEDKETKYHAKIENEPTKSQPIYSLEKRIVGLLLIYPRESRKVMGKISPHDFLGSAERKIFQIIKGSGENYTLDGIKKKFSDYELDKLLDEAVFEIEVETENRALDPRGEIESCFKRLKQTGLKEKIKKITEDIRKADKAGDKEAVKILMNEFQNLTSQIEIWI